MLVFLVGLVDVFRPCFSWMPEVGVWCRLVDLWWVLVGGLDFTSLVVEDLG